MASVFFKRLQDKYGSENIRGKKYNAMVKEILAHNNEKAGRAVARLSKENYNSSIKRLSKERAKTVKLPDMTEVLPKRSVFLIKGADSGAAVSDKLRTSLERDLRQTLLDFSGTGKNKMEIQRGKTTGKINTELIAKFQDRITKTFESRTKRDPNTGVPPNVKAIAVTEIRSTVGMVKEQYNRRLMKENTDWIMTKTWLHNRQLSKKPRRGHLKLDGVTIGMDDFFEVKRDDNGVVERMSRPHDPKASPENVIQCNCDIRYQAKLKTYK